MENIRYYASTRKKPFKVTVRWSNGVVNVNRFTTMVEVLAHRKEMMEYKSSLTGVWAVEIITEKEISCWSTNAVLLKGEE